MSYGLTAAKQRQRNRIPLRDVTCVIHMQMIAAVESGKNLGRAVWVPHRRVEIDDGIEGAAAAYPVIVLLTDGFSFGGIELHIGLLEERVLKRRHSRPDDSNSLLMRTRDELTIAGYDVSGRYPFVWRNKRERREKDVVDPESHENVLDACLSQHVTFETRQPRLAESCPIWIVGAFRAVTQQAVADDAEIQDG